MISGAGVRGGVTLEKIQNVDITPTMAVLLGIPFPNADGKVIREALK